MTCKTIEAKNLAAAIEIIEKLAENHDVIFRGHNSAKFTLQTSHARYTSTAHESWDSSLDDLIDHFRSGLVQINRVPFESHNRQDWLEYARHLGVPTPCLDFSRSPYIALFFSFSGLRKNSFNDPDDPFVALYCLNISQLAFFWTYTLGSSSRSHDDRLEDRHKFLYPQSSPFENGFPGGQLVYIPFPSRYNRRMQVQMGCLLYDTIDYSAAEWRGLEEMIASAKEPEESKGAVTIPGDPILTKILIPKTENGKAFEKLELMGITGRSLYMDEAGLVEDIWNSYYYNSRSLILRDVRLPLLDDTKMKP